MQFRKLIKHFDKYILKIFYFIIHILTYIILTKIDFILIKLVAGFKKNIKIIQKKYLGPIQWW